MEKRGQACYLYVNWLNLSALIQFAETGAVQTGAVQTGLIQTGPGQNNVGKVASGVLQ